MHVCMRVFIAQLCLCLCVFFSLSILYSHVLIVFRYIFPLVPCPLEAVWCAVLLLTVLIYFPAKPPTPPCASAGVQRESFVQGLKSLLRSLPDPRTRVEGELVMCKFSPQSYGLREVTTILTLTIRL